MTLLQNKDFLLEVIWGVKDPMGQNCDFGDQLVLAENNPGIEFTGPVARQFTDNIETVLLALQLTQGLWKELAYSYKAKELVSHAKAQCERIMAKQGPRHHALIKKLKYMEKWASNLMDAYYADESDTLRQPQQRKCGCPVNAPEANPDEYPCPCGNHCTSC